MSSSSWRTCSSRQVQDPEERKHLLAELGAAVSVFGPSLGDRQGVRTQWSDGRSFPLVQVGLVGPVSNVMFPGKVINTMSSTYARPTTLTTGPAIDPIATVTSHFSLDRTSGSDEPGEREDAQRRKWTRRNR